MHLGQSKSLYCPLDLNFYKVNCPCDSNLNISEDDFYANYCKTAYFHILVVLVNLLNKIGCSLVKLWRKSILNSL